MCTNISVTSISSRFPQMLQLLPPLPEKEEVGVQHQDDAPPFYEGEANQGIISTSFNQLSILSPNIFQNIKFTLRYSLINGQFHTKFFVS